MSLKSRRKFGFCDGSVKKPTEAKLLEQWEVVHCTVVRWIRNMIDPSVLTSVPFVEEASVLWRELAERFAVVDGTSVHALKTDLGNCKQIKGMSVTEYYGKLSVLWDALAIHEPPFACKCGRCLCDISSQAVKRLDNERLHQFFMGLDRNLYGAIRNQQLQLDPLPTLNRGYHAVLQAERLLLDDTSSTDVTNVVAFAVPGASSNVPDWKAIREHEKLERRKYFCTHCEVNGHDVNHCFIKTNKFPDWWGSRPRTLEELRRKKKGGAGPRPNASGTPVVHANAAHTDSSFASSDRLSGPFYEDDDWSR